MPNMTLAIPDELYNKMKKHSEYRWSKIAINAFEEVIKKTEIQGELFSAIASRNKKKMQEISNKVFEENPFFKKRN